MIDREFDVSEDFARHMDKKDPIGEFRERFYIPGGKIYLDGNSLGLMSKDSQGCLSRVMQEWQARGIDGWLGAEPPWFYFAEKLGEMAAPLVGAEPQEVVSAASTTVNIHSLVSTFFRPQGKRTKILADELNFPSDIYALKGQLKLKGLNPADQLILVKSPDARTLDEERIAAHMSPEVAVALFSSVLYRSGQLLDMKYLTDKAHEQGIIIGFDCSHSVGAVPHKLDEWGVDFALWCSYKYLNGGPGSPAFLYVNRRHFNREPLLAGWFGCDKAKQFDMSLDFFQAKGAGAWQISSPVILGAAVVEGALKVFQEAGIERVREKSLLMTSYLIFLVENVLSMAPYRINIGTPRDPRRRGGHVALEREEDAWALCQAMKARAVVPDFRLPNIIRVAPAALYNTFHQVWQTVQIIKEIIDNQEYLEFRDRKAKIT